MPPFFSIIIPLYNKENEIEATLQSVFKQDFEDYEVVLINDGSTDASEQKVLSFSDSRLVYKKTQNQGVSMARNTGINLAKGTLIAFLDADDLWFPSHLSDLLYLHQRFPEAGLLATNYEFHYGNGKTIQPTFIDIPNSEWHGIVSDFFKSSMNYRLAWTSAVAIPKKVLEKVGDFDENITLGAGEDTDLWIRIALKYQVAFSTKISAKYNMAATSQVTTSKTLDRKFSKLDKFKIEEANNPSLSKFLDLYRTVYALKHKIAGDQEKFRFYYNSIHQDSTSFIMKLLLRMPTFLLRFLYAINQKGNTQLFHLKFYTTLFR